MLIYCGANRASKFFLLFSLDLIPCGVPILFRARFPGTTSFRELVQSAKIKLIRGTVVDMARVSTPPPTTTSTTLSQYTLTIDSPIKPGPLTLTADIVIFGTGWRTGSYPFLSRSLVEELGLPFTYRRFQLGILPQ